MPIKAMPVALLALAACQGAPVSNAANETEQANAPVKEVETLPPNETVVTEANSAAAAADGAAFPVAFHGRWGLTAADCDPARSDNKGLLTVSPDRVAFYESRGTIKTIALESPRKAVVDLAFSGEGQTWERKSVYEVTDGGKTLLRVEDEPAMPYRYARCQDAQ